MNETDETFSASADQIAEKEIKISSLQLLEIKWIEKRRNRPLRESLERAAIIAVSDFERCMQFRADDTIPPLVSHWRLALIRATDRTEKELEGDK